VKVEQRGWRKPAPTLFREYAEQWFVENETRRRWKPATVRAYVFVRRRLIDGFGAMPLAEIRPRHVAEWAAKAKGGASTVSRDLAILHAIFDSAERQELIGSNPAKRIERPRQPRRRWRLLEPSEVPAVSKAFTDARARRVFLTLLLTGLRRSELQALRWGHVNLLEATLRVVESKSEEGERLIALPPMLVQVLSEQYAATPYKADTDYVFAHPERGTSLGAEVVRGGVHEDARRGRHHRLDPAVPRHAAHGVDEPRRDGCLADRGDGDRRAPVDADDEAVSAPGRRRVQ
jgi:integrase